jgi:hypothetical protein
MIDVDWSNQVLPKTNENSQYIINDAGKKSNYVEDSKVLGIVKRSSGNELVIARFTTE